PRLLRQKFMRAGGVEIIPSGRSRFQTPLDVLTQTRGLPQSRKQIFARLELAALERRGHAPLGFPGVGDGDEQTRIVSGLQQVSHMPVLRRGDGATGRRGDGEIFSFLPVALSPRRLVSLSPRRPVAPSPHLFSGFFQTETEPERRLGRNHNRASPLTRLNGELSHLRRRAFHHAVR